MTNEQQLELMREAMSLRDRLFDIANLFAGDETGHIAVTLHASCNSILWAKDSLDHYIEFKKG